MVIVLLPLLLLTWPPAIAICEARYGVPAALVYEVIRYESRGQTLAVSPSGQHRGLMQVGARWARVPGWALHVPAVGVVEGCRLLAGWQAVCLRRVTGTQRRAGALVRWPAWRCALVGYRAGWKAAIKEKSNEDR